MNRILITIAILVALTANNIPAASRVIVSFDQDWKFTLSEPKNAQAPSYDDTSWRTLNLPHDWSIEGEVRKSNPGEGHVGFFPTGIGWYRKTFDIDAFDASKLYSIEFDGIYMLSTVWINGHELGTWPYGYSSFSYDITPFLKPKGNVIAVKVDNSQQPNSRWYSGSGIYRHVRLVGTDKTHFEKWGVFNHTLEVKDGEAAVKVEYTIVNTQNKEINAVVRHEVIDMNGKVVAQQSKEALIPIDGKLVDDQTIPVAQPVLWTLKTPYLYTLRSHLIVNGKIIDAVDNTMGIRTIEYDADKGFLLNGEHVKMCGVNLHHDCGPVGAAVPERVWERRLEILKSSGCNAIRTSHNPPAPEFLDLCDRLGFLVMDEAFDVWVNEKRKFDYHLYFKEWNERDLTAMVTRDRNHPSVVMWSVGNEIADQSFEHGGDLSSHLISICHKYDPTRLVTSGMDRIAAPEYPATEASINAFADDIVGYNYGDRWLHRRAVLYAPDKAQHPERRIVATETTGLGGVRSTYHIPPKNFDASTTEANPRKGRMMRRFAYRGMIDRNLLDVEWRWRYTMDYDYVIGDFMWTGIDHYGETQWPSRGCTVGYLDNCGFKKDAYYFFKSIWTDEPVVHIFPHWNWEGHEGQIIQVVCYSNCEYVELFVNGKSYGRKATDLIRCGQIDGKTYMLPGAHIATTNDLHLVWDVEYQPGEIRAVGTMNGKQYEKVIKTAGKPAKIRLSVDRDSFRADPSDVAHVTAEVLDAEDNPVPITDNLIKFEVSGGSILGVENGNMTDLAPVKADERKAFAGKCLAIIGASKEGPVNVVATSDGLTPAHIRFDAK